MLSVMIQYLWMLLGGGIVVHPRLAVTWIGPQHEQL